MKSDERERTKGKNNNDGVRVRQMTREERAAVDVEAEAVAAEILGLTAAADEPKVSLGARLRSAVRRGVGAVRGAGLAVRRLANRDNLDRALGASTAYGKMAAKYGVDAARRAVERRIQNAIEGTINEVVGGAGGSAGGKVRS